MCDIVVKKTVTPNRRFQAMAGEKVGFGTFVVYCGIYIHEDLADFWLKSWILSWNRCLSCKQYAG